MELNNVEHERRVILMLRGHYGESVSEMSDDELLTKTDGTFIRVAIELAIAKEDTKKAITDALPVWVRRLFGMEAQ